MADILGFQYEIYVVEDGQMGSEQYDGSWNGLVGELLYGVSVLCIC